jgi:hypothetical protein
MIEGRARIGSLGTFATIGGTLFRLIATYVHLPLAGSAAGVWLRP